MKVIIGMATYDGPGRKASLEQALKSLRGQCAQIFLYDNSIRPLDLTDNGKFFGLTQLEEPVYYLTCDDDLLYPETYVKDMVEAIEKHQSIVSHHGRKLLGLDRNYYRGHKGIRCLCDNELEMEIDVPGTGCTGFRTDYFNPTEIWNAKEKKMSDLVFGLEAAKQNKKIIVLKHSTGYIKQLKINLKDTIFSSEVGNCLVQNELANQIYKLKY